VELGQGDFSQALTSARDSGADIIFLSVAGGDMASTSNQAAEFDIYEEAHMVYPVVTVAGVQSVDPAVRANSNWHGALDWNWTLDTPETNRLVEASRNEYGEPPAWPGANMYAHLRTIIKTINEVGSKAADDIAPALEGADIRPQIWNGGEYIRACNHASIMPSLVMQGTNPDEIDEERQNYIQVEATVDDYDVIYQSCEDTGCSAYWS
jgi:ABC-type branched-subunit amino acid transport system substrate-binding protein